MPKTEIDYSNTIFYKIYCKDENEIENNSPTHFNIQTYADMPPDILVFEPTSKVELGESMEIPMRIMVNDDYGISEMEIKYSIIHPDYIPKDTMQYHFPLTGFEKNIKSQNYSFIWDINFLSLMIFWYSLLIFSYSEL